MELPIWSGKQRNLFEKYGVKRRRTIKMIVANLEALRDNLKADGKMQIETKKDNEDDCGKPGDSERQPTS
jgi:hypothetical protein